MDQAGGNPTVGVKTTGSVSYFLFWDICLLWRVLNLQSWTRRTGTRDKDLHAWCISETRTFRVAAPSFPSGLTQLISSIHSMRTSRTQRCKVGPTGWTMTKRTFVWLAFVCKRRNPKLSHWKWISQESRQEDHWGEESLALNVPLWLTCCSPERDRWNGPFDNQLGWRLHLHAALADVDSLASTIKPWNFRKMIRPPPEPCQTIKTQEFQFWLLHNQLHFHTVNHQIEITGLSIIFNMNVGNLKLWENLLRWIWSDLVAKLQLIQRE